MTTWHFPLVRRHRIATITTLHGLLHRHDLREFLEEYNDVPLVSISEDQQRPMSDANWFGTVHHGLPRELHTFRATSKGYFAFLGRIAPEKGVERAVETARQAGVPLKIAAKIYPEDRTYYEQAIRSLFSEHQALVEFVGEVGGAAKDEFLSGATALLFPVEWPEPFGLVMIEALACGTPVIAWRRGSVPEVIEDGVTGHIVDDLDGAVAAAKRISEIDRSACRASFERRFETRRMADDYVAIYKKVCALELQDRPGANR